MSLRDMRAVIRGATFAAIVMAGLILLPSLVLAEPFAAEASKLLPANLSSFRQTSPVKVIDRKAWSEILKLIGDIDSYEVSQLYVATTEYQSAGGEKLGVTLMRFENDAAAYSLFTLLRRNASREPSNGTVQPQRIGSASVLTGGAGLTFFKGPYVVSIRAMNSGGVTTPAELGQPLAASIPASDDDFPVLLKHLPNWESVEAQTMYAIKASDLEPTVPNQPILKEINFEGGTEAVTATYGQAQLVIVEFTTPQFSIDNDSRIWTKIAELKAQGQPTPSAYRRVGNYSVFVFNAADEKSAGALIDQVKYEQVVQWLGDDPHLYERLQRYFTQTSAGVLVAVLKSSGLSLLFCLAAGALIGTMMFRRRRAQRAEAFSDAGGSTRLNLDELTGSANTTPLLSGGTPSRSDSTTT